MEYKQTVRRERLQDIGQRKLLTRPLSHINHFLSSAFYHIRQTFSMERFIDVYIKDVKGADVVMKLDETGWALDEGRALDLLVKH